MDESVNLSSNGNVEILCKYNEIYVNRHSLKGKYYAVHIPSR